MSPANLPPDACMLGPFSPIIHPTAVVIFGATGDLTHRKIIPAFYHLLRNNQFPEGCAIIGYARRPRTDAEFRCGLREALGRFSHTQPVDDAIWEKLAAHIYYQQGDLTDPQGYAALARRLDTLPESAAFQRSRLFYLATAPHYFGQIAERLASSGLALRETGPASAQRVVIEKPFGEDLASARALNATLHRVFPEESICRIDHYLGKETVQNLLYFRFGNSIYEPLWNRRYIDHVQITVAEQLGVEGRGGYYDGSGAARDMLQNHMFQLLTLVAMEPPASLEAESIHDEKVKVLRSIPTPSAREVAADSVRAQYGAGHLGDRPLAAYRAEPNVAPDSTTETYAAWKLQIDNWRWSGVPFYLRTGKTLACQCTEIHIVFNRPPSVLFAAVCGMRLHRNCLCIRIQPNEGITLDFNAKSPGRPVIQRVNMDFTYRKDGGNYLPEAYERLMVDALVGESTLFARNDEVEEAWRLVDALRNGWQAQGIRELPLYAPGSMGPTEAEALLARDGREWR